MSLKCNGCAWCCKWCIHKTVKHSQFAYEVSRILWFCNTLHVMHQN